MARGEKTYKKEIRKRLWRLVKFTIIIYKSTCDNRGDTVWEEKEDIC